MRPSLQRVQSLLNYAELQYTRKHLAGQHDQRRHAPVSVTHAGSKLPVGEYESHGFASTRGKAEGLMMQLSATKNYKAANAAGWFTAKIGDEYHVINTSRPALSEGFRRVVQDIEEQNPYTNANDARQQAANAITEGFRDVGEAAEMAATFADREVMGYTAYGYEYNAKDLLTAIRVRSEYDSDWKVKPPEPKPEPVEEPEPAPSIDPTLKIRPGVAHSNGVAEIGGDGTPAQKRLVQNALMDLPEQHQKYLFNVYAYNSGRLGENALAANGAYAVGQASNSNFTMAVAARGSTESVKLTAAHEAAHLIFGSENVYGTTNEFQDRRAQTRRTLSQLWFNRARAIGHKTSATGKIQSAAVAKKMHLVTSYAACNPDEFRAESYSYYVHNPKVLKAKDPETYAILKDFFDGQEY